jgi:hypothetical protein
MVRALSFGFVKIFDQGKAKMQLWPKKQQMGPQPSYHWFAIDLARFPKLRLSIEQDKNVADISTFSKLKTFVQIFQTFSDRCRKTSKNYDFGDIFQSFPEHVFLDILFENIEADIVLICSQGLRSYICLNKKTKNTTKTTKTKNTRESASHPTLHRWWSKEPQVEQHSYHISKKKQCK